VSFGKVAGPLKARNERGSDELWPGANRIERCMNKFAWIVAGGAALLAVAVIAVRSPEVVAHRARASRAPLGDGSAHTPERFASREPGWIETQIAPGAVGWTPKIPQAGRTRLNALPIPPRVSSLLPDVWVHEGDSDGDGLTDEFEVRHGLDPRKVCTFLDGVPDEQRIAPDGRTYGEIQEAEKRGEPCRHQAGASMPSR
jgi:hypothetical protein